MANQVDLSNGAQVKQKSPSDCGILGSEPVIFGDRKSIVLLYREWYKPQNVRILNFWMAVQWIDHVEVGAVCRHVAATLSFQRILISRPSWV